MTSYRELLEQREQLEKQIQQARAREVSEQVVKVRQWVEMYGLTPQDVFPGLKLAKPSKPAKGSAPKVMPKYRDPQTGATWTGRGKPPTWIAGKDRASFEIQ